MISQGMMRCGTIFSSKTYSGYKIDVVKSGLQKYCRRRETDKMIRCMVEMDLFNIFGTKGKGIRSNMINRLKVMCYEELCFCDIGSFMSVMKRIEKWDASNRNNRKILVEICIILTHGELLRLASDIKNYYWNVFPSLIENGENPSYPSFDKCIVENYKGGDDNDDILYELGHFIQCLDAKNNEAFYRAFNIIKKAIEGVKGARRWRRKDCDYIIWKVLFDRSEGNDILQSCLNYALKEYFKKNRSMKGDRLVVIINAILWVMHRDVLKWDNTDDVEFVTDTEVEKYYHLTEQMFVDGYVLDKHCSLGRQMGKNLADFAKEGSYVKDENKDWYDDTMRKAYIDSKLTIEDKLEEIKFEDITDLRLCMEKTCGNKVMCWYGKYKNEPIVLKEGRKSMNYNRDYIVVDNLKLVFGLNQIGMKRVVMNKKSMKKDKTKSSWVDNNQWVDAQRVVYCMMKRIDGDLLIHKKEEIKGDVLRELIKIGIYRGIFRVSDFNLRNVLIDKDNKLFSIDEHGIGKKNSIFTTQNGSLFKKNITKELVDDVLDDFLSYPTEDIHIIIRLTLEQYKFDKIIVDKVIENFNNLKTDVYQEFGLQ